MNMLQFLKYPQNSVERYVFIVGCQRSGTTMLGRCFAEDIQVKEYGEYGLAKTTLRMPQLDTVLSIAQRQRGPIFVAKPLVESHRILEMLDFFPNAYAIWMVRHYKDVANSSFRRFGVRATRENLGAVVRNDRSHWMAAGVSDTVRRTVVKYYDEDMPPLDGKALIWYVRNSLFFEQNLGDHPQVQLLHYADITANPTEVMPGIYRFIDAEYPGDHVVADIHQKSVGLGKQVNLNPAIEAICAELWERFDILGNP